MASYSSTHEQPHYPHVSQQPPPGGPMAYQTRPRGYSSSSQTQYNQQQQQQQQQPWDPSYGPAATHQTHPPPDTTSHLAPTDALTPYAPNTHQNQLQPYSEPYIPYQQQSYEEPGYTRRPSHHRAHKSSASQRSRHSHMSQEEERELEHRPSLGDSIFGVIRWIGGVLDPKRR